MASDFEVNTAGIKSVIELKTKPFPLSAGSMAISAFLRSHVEVISETH